MLLMTRLRHLSAGALAQAEGYGGQADDCLHCLQQSRQQGGASRYFGNQGVLMGGMSPLPHGAEAV